MVDRQQAELGDVQQTLFVPLTGRARESRRKRPLLRDPKAVEIVESVDFDESLYSRGWGGFATVLRTLIFDWWVRQFLAEHPDGTVVELGTGLNTRFERTDNGTAHWIELDLPDTIELRRRFFVDTDRRRMVAGSVLDEDWIGLVAAEPAPYFFVSEGVLVYLPEEDVTRTLSRIADRFPGASLSFDTYSKAMFDRQHKEAARRGMPTRWAWACDDPRLFERFGLRLAESATITRPPRGLRAGLPPRYRYLLPLANPLLGQAIALSLFQAGLTGRGHPAFRVRPGSLISYSAEKTASPPGATRPPGCCKSSPTAPA
jgi:O-methyltransferase involved in polyketide biosynthesis